MKNKLCLCFRPGGIETEIESNGADGFGDRVFTCISVSHHRDAKISLVKSPVSTIERSKCSKNAIRTRKRDASWSVSGVAKAVLFEISLKKKVRNRKASQLTVGSKSSDSSKSEAFSDISKSPDNNFQGIKSDSSASSSPTSCSSSYSSSTPKNLSNSSLNQKKQSINCPRQHSKAQIQNKVTGYSSLNAGLFLILISLAITMFYGRLCAILFTSLCLYFLSRRSNCQQLPQGNMVRSSPEMEPSASDNRKRAIMEGLLERNHRRRGH